MDVDRMCFSCALSHGVLSWVNVLSLCCSSSWWVFGKCPRHCGVQPRVPEASAPLWPRAQLSSISQVGESSSIFLWILLNVTMSWLPFILEVMETDEDAHLNRLTYFTLSVTLVHSHHHTEMVKLQPFDWPSLCTLQNTCSLSRWGYTLFFCAQQFSFLIIHSLW